MPKLSIKPTSLGENGVVHLLVLLILLLGIIGTVYLINAGSLKLFPKAASEPISVPITPTPTPSSSPSPTPTPTSSKPDLIVSNITAYGTNKVKSSASFYVTIQNIGADLKTSFGISMTVVTTKPNGNTLGTCTAYFTNLAAGVSTTFNLPSCGHAYTVVGNYTVTAIVDSINIVSEIDENNNKSSIVVNVIK